LVNHRIWIHPPNQLLSHHPHFMRHTDIRQFLVCNHAHTTASCCVLLANTIPPVPFSRRSSLKADAREDFGPSSTRGDLAWGPHAEPNVRDAECCPPGCGGSSCSKMRLMLQDLISEITRDPFDPSLPSIGHQPPKPVSSYLHFSRPAFYLSERLDYFRKSATCLPLMSDIT
jgi:hypothetical protein